VNDPIYLKKNGIAFPLEKLGFIERPFQFCLKDGHEWTVYADEQPIYFARKRMRVSSKGTIKRQYIHRYCVGTKDKNGVVNKHWVYPDGTYDVSGDQPSE